MKTFAALRPDGQVVDVTRANAIDLLPPRRDGLTYTECDTWVYEGCKTDDNGVTWKDPRGNIPTALSLRRTITKERFWSQLSFGAQSKLWELITTVARPTVFRDGATILGIDMLGVARSDDNELKRILDALVTANVLSADDRKQFFMGDQ